MISDNFICPKVLSADTCVRSNTFCMAILILQLTGHEAFSGYLCMEKISGASTALYISSSVMSFGSRASAVDPFCPVQVTTKPALESFANIRLTKLGLALTLDASPADVVSDPDKWPKPAIM